MAVTTTYALLTAPPLPLFDGGVHNFDMSETASGGLFVSGMEIEVSDRPLRYTTFSATGKAGDQHGALQDLESCSVATLADGNLVIASLGEHDGNPGGDVGFTILTASILSPVKDWTFPVIDNAANVQVEALAGGGFVIAADMASSETDHDIGMWLYNAAGDLVSTPFINTDELDVGPSIAALDDGKFSISWRMQTGSDFAVMNALLSADGLIFIQTAHGVEIVDDAPEVQSIATEEGYALVYEDGLDLMMTTFDTDGLQIGARNLTDNLDNACRDVSLTRLDNGLIAYSYSYDFQPGDHDIYMQIIDPGTFTKLFDGEQIITQELDDERASVIQDFGLGQFAFGWNEDEDTGKGASFGLQRTTIGDNAANTMTGDDSVDLMNGGRGADTMLAGDNNDQLRGQGDKDVINGGRGNDLIIGGGGVDSLSGHKGKDVFLFEALTDSGRKNPDRILDLSNEDRIDLRSIDADTSQDGDQKFHLVDAFTDNAREAMLTFHVAGKYAGATTLDLDVNGDGVADFRVVIDGDHADFTRFGF